MNWYYKFLVRHPFFIILGISVLSMACIIVSLGFTELPDFSDPTLGFQARGTNIGKRWTTWNNLIHETKLSGKLVADPNDLIMLIKNDNNQNHRNMKKHFKHYKNRKKKKNKKLNKNLENFKIIKNEQKLQIDNNFKSINEIQFRDYEINNDTLDEFNNTNNESYQFGTNRSYINDEDLIKSKLQTKKKWKSLRSKNPPLNIEIHNRIGYFCDSPDKEYSHFVIERIGPNSTDSLFDVNALLSMCQLEDYIINTNGYTELCQKELYSEICCKPWSLPNYIALLNNKSSCFDIEKDDVIEVQNLLVMCFDYFQEFKLSSDCSEEKCRAPIECTKFDAVFSIMHFLTDINFIKLNESNIFLKYSIIFIPVARSTKVLQFFHELEERDLSTELVKVSAMNLGLKNALFDESLLSDAWLVGLGGIFVMACICLYTSSIFITFMTLTAIIFSLGLAYFIYTSIFELTFFPFMNLLSIVVIIGIGADDAFIFVKIWQCTIADRTNQIIGLPEALSFTTETNQESLTNIMSTTFKHAALSMFVTSLTTSIAFYANIFSAITSVKCFGIFAGIAITTNYLLMITWLPASISIMERMPCHIAQFFPSYVLHKLSKSINNLGIEFEKLIMKCVLKFPKIWITLFGIIGICSCIIVLYWPGFQLPESSEFQLFVSDHPFEIYDSKFNNLFWFQRAEPSLNNIKLPLRFVWGILSIDDGDYYNPDSRGELHYDNNFDISSIESQIWLLNFCKNIKKQNFYHSSSFGFLLPNCFIENFISWMNRKCFDYMDDVDRTPCCEISKFPYEPNIFDKCLPHSISSLYATPREFFTPGVAGPKFISINDDNKIHENLTTIDNNENDTNIDNLQSLKVQALIIEFESNFSYSTSYADIDNFINTAQSWFNKEIRNAPKGMRNGWFISELEFYDLQSTLSKGTLVAISIAMVASLIILLCVTLNVLVSFYAVITVTFTIFSTIAILILLGWKLNILESIAVSTVVGLAVDFSLHYGITYRLSAQKDRLSSTSYALSRIVGPTAFAALTTAFAGLIMVFSKVLPYIQIGIFLLVVMIVSWFYATFFLMSLLCAFGPQNGFMQFDYPSIKRRTKEINIMGFNDRKHSQIIAGEQLLTPSSSAVGELITSESHELDSLTNSFISNSVIKSNNEMTNLSIELLKNSDIECKGQENSFQDINITMINVPVDVNCKI